MTRICIILAVAIPLKCAIVRSDSVLGGIFSGACVAHELAIVLCSLHSIKVASHQLELVTRFSEISSNPRSHDESTLHCSIRNLRFS